MAAASLATITGSTNAQVARLEIYPISSVILDDTDFPAGRSDGQPATIAGELPIPKADADEIPAVILLYGLR